MKNITVMLVMLFAFGSVSAQVNKIDPVTTVPAPGSPPVENATQKINREQTRQAAPTPLITQPPVSNTSNTSVQPVQRESNGNTTVAPYPTGNPAYPVPQGALQPGTATTTGPVNGTNNPTTTLPASNTTNQGKVP